MRVREAAGRRRLVAPLLALLVSCSGGADTASPVQLEPNRTPAQLRALLESISERTDPEASIARARIYSRLREQEPGVSITLLALGDSADIEVMSHGASPGAKSESAARLCRHFRERSENPVLSRSSFPGHLGEPLRRLILLTISAFYGECGSRSELAETMIRMSTATLEFADREALSPEAVKLLKKRAEEASARAAELNAQQGPLEAGVEVRKFCDYDAARHMEEGTRAADLGTREKAHRAELEGVLQWYLLALAHYGVVRETVMELSPAQEHALAAQEIVVRSLCDLVCREP